LIWLSIDKQTDGGMMLRAVQPVKSRWAERQEEEDFGKQRLIEEQGAYILLSQWEKSQGPLDPMVRVALSMADVVLEYIGANPAIFGVGGSGEKFVAGLSTNLRELLPDPERVDHWAEGGWAKFYFAERAITIFLHAGFKMIGEHPEPASKGSRLCESLDRKRFGTPRDCAILSMLPALIAHDRWVGQFKELGTKNPEDKTAFLESFSANYKWNTWDAVSAQESVLAKDPRIDESVLLYVERQKNYFYCTAVKVQKELQEFMNALDDPKALEKEFDDIVNQRDEMERSLGQDRVSCQDLEY
jgi:hypothetical protein